MRISISHPAARAAQAVSLFSRAGVAPGAGLLLAPDAEEAERLFEVARVLLPVDTPPLFLPAWPETGFEPVAPPPEVAAERCLALAALARGAGLPGPGGGIVVAEIAAVLRRTRPAEEMRRASLRLEYATAIDPVDLRRRLIEAGYVSVAEVGEVGDFAPRGGILDLFPPGTMEGLPVRIEFEEDLVSSLRLFDPATQRSREEIPFLLIPPTREIPLGAVPEAAQKIRAAIRAWRAARGGASGGEAEEIPLRAEALAEAVGEGAYREGIEVFLPFLAPGAAPPISFDGVRLFLSRPDEIREAARRLWEEVEGEAATSDLAYDPALLWARPPEIEPFLARAEVEMEAAPSSLEIAVLETRPLPPAPPDSPVLRVDLARLARDKTRVVVGTEFVERVREEAGGVPIEIRSSSLHEGIWIPSMSLALVGDADLFGPRRRKGRRATAKRSLLDWRTLSPGEAVVHVQHGVGIYRGLVRITVSGAERDVIRIEYAGSDVLYLPPAATDRLERWVAPEGTTLRLDSLGGGSWERTRAKVTAETKEIARRLLDLYALRETVRANPFAPHAEEASFESSFPYEETPDQEAALAGVLAGLAGDRPMDHLVVGDVGFGKTEVALRAAFRAIRRGAQVAILAPTTILAEQHYETVRERMSPFGIKTGALSRLRSPREIEATLGGLAKGELDLVVGTHRLLSKDVKFHRLGLVVIDEEQRFGVRHKERLKEIRHLAHCLTLTATPIPRTLHLALSSLRDLSVIRTPPPGRVPVSTIVAPYEPELVKRAIERERARGGGIFFVHNRIESIERVREFLLRLVPDLRIVVLHGRSDEKSLARGMAEFSRGEAELLLSTSIIENGLDIPRANTLIVDRADRFGLSDLYQLRGRVGRSDRRAYAYFLYPADGTMTPAGRHRLEKVAEHTSLGSGFALAMEDLELRGAGEILGARQSGLFAQVGYDLYVRLLREAIEEVRGLGEAWKEPAVCEISWNAFLPEEWIGSKDLAPRLYREIAGARSLADLAEVRNALADRFGPLPAPVENLFYQAEIAILAGLDGAKRVVQIEDRIEIEWLGEIPEEAMDVAARRALPRWREGKTLRIGLGAKAKPAKIFEILRAIVRR